MIPNAVERLITFTVREGGKNITSGGGKPAAKLITHHCAVRFSTVNRNRASSEYHIGKFVFQILL